MSLSSSVYSHDSGSELDLVKRFQFAGRLMQAFGKQAGIRISPYTDESLPIFRKMDVNAQRSAVEKLEISADVFSSIHELKEDLRNPNTVTWMACKKLGLTPPSDFFSFLSGDDVIQIYSSAGIHLFANLRCYEVCSYTLEQLFCHPWTLLWQRDEAELMKLLGYVEKVMQPATKMTVECKTQKHLVIETSSPFQYHNNYSLQYIAPLFDKSSHEKSGYIAAESVELLNSVSEHEEEKMLSDFYHIHENVTHLRGAPSK